MGLVQWMDPFFHPLNTIFEPLFRPLFTLFSGVLINPFLQLLDNIASTYGQFDLIPPALPYDITMGMSGATSGETLSITQGLLGLLFTFLFFLCSFGSQMLKAAEQRMDVAKQDFMQRRRLQQLQSEHRKHQHRAVINKNIMVSIMCDFQKNATTQNTVEQLLSRSGGISRDVTPDTMAVEFQQIETGLKFTSDVLRQVLHYYRSLRPMDVQPPIKIGVHTHIVDESPQATILQCKALSNFAGNNQVILSQDIKHMLDAVGLQQQFVLSPLGAYYLEGIGAQELYRLEF